MAEAEAIDADWWRSGSFVLLRMSVELIFAAQAGWSSRGDAALFGSLQFKDGIWNSEEVSFVVHGFASVSSLIFTLDISDNDLSFSVFSRADALASVWFIRDASVSPIQSPRDDWNRSSTGFAGDLNRVALADSDCWRRRSFDGRRGTSDLVGPVGAVKFLVAEVRVRNALIARLTLPLSVSAATSRRCDGAISLVPSISAVVVAVAFPDLHDAFSARTLVLIRFAFVIPISATLSFVTGVSAVWSSVTETSARNTFSRLAFKLGSVASTTRVRTTASSNVEDSCGGLREESTTGRTFVSARVAFQYSIND